MCYITALPHYGNISSNFPVQCALLYGKLSVRWYLIPCLYFSSPVICVALMTFPLASPPYLSLTLVHTPSSTSPLPLFENLYWLSTFSWLPQLLKTTSPWELSQQGIIIWNKTMPIGFETVQPQLGVYSVSSLETHIILLIVDNLLNTPHNKKKTKTNKKQQEKCSLRFRHRVFFLFSFGFFFVLLCFIVCMRNCLGQFQIFLKTHICAEPPCWQHCIWSIMKERGLETAFHVVNQGVPDKQTYS